MIKGGLGLFTMVALPAVGALSGAILTDIYKFVKKKITGSGINIPSHKSNSDKKDFLIEILKHIK